VLFRSCDAADVVAHEGGVTRRRGARLVNYAVPSTGADGADGRETLASGGGKTKAAAQSGEEGEADNGDDDATDAGDGEAAGEHGGEDVGDESGDAVPAEQAAPVDDAGDGAGSLDGEQQGLPEVRPGTVGVATGGFGGVGGAIGRLRASREEALRLVIEAAAGVAAGELIDDGLLAEMIEVAGMDEAQWESELANQRERLAALRAKEQAATAASKIRAITEKVKLKMAELSAVTLRLNAEISRMRDEVNRLVVIVADAERADSVLKQTADPAMLKSLKLATGAMAGLRATEREAGKAANAAKERVVDAETLFDKTESGTDAAKAADTALESASVAHTKAIGSLDRARDAVAAKQAALDTIKQGIYGVTV